MKSSATQGAIRPNTNSDKPEDLFVIHYISKKRIEMLSWSLKPPKVLNHS